MGGEIQRCKRIRERERKIPVAKAMDANFQIVFSRGIEKERAKRERY